MDKILTKYIEHIKSINADNIVIYGAGANAKEIYKFLKSNNVNVSAFCVTNSDANVEQIDGCPVYQYSEMQLNPDSTLILIGFRELGESRLEKELAASKWKYFIPIPDYTFVKRADDSRDFRPEIEVTTKIGCSVNCKFCPQKNLLNAYYKNDKSRKTFFDYDDYVKCIDKLPKDTIIDFAGFVEPFLNERCVDMMEYAANKGMEVTLYTTLVGLKKDELKRVLDIPFKEVVLHTADNQGYAEIPVTDDYLYCMDAFLEAKKADGKLFVDDVNCQCEPHPEVVKRTKGRYKVYRELMDRAGNLVGEEYKDLVKADKHGPLVCSGMEKLNHNILLPDGTVVLCCNDFSLQHVLGNLLQQDYEDIMNSEMVKYVRDAMLHDDGRPLLCRKCAYAKEVGRK